MEVDNAIYKCPKCYKFQVRHFEPNAPVYFCYHCFRSFYLVVNLLGERVFLKATRKGEPLGFWVEMKKGNSVEPINPFDDREEIPF